jgi:flagellar hook-associated protein FlgK
MKNNTQTMKTKFLALAMSLGLLIASCSKDDDATPVTVAALTGNESIIVGATTTFASTTTGGTFTSATPAVATVDAKTGVITGVTVGTSVITYTVANTAGPVTRTVTVTAIPAATGEITGDFTADKVYAYGNYTLKGMVKIPSGVTVTFTAGSTITCDKSTGENGLIILLGGKLIANGTADAPIVFTEKSKIGGSWAGIIMYGDAPIVNSASAPAPQSATSEDGLALKYGGSNATHNGGSLKYVRVEYAGQVITTNNKENNGFSFYSVGSGTTLDHLVSYKGNDDGFEFYGGTVSLTNSISYGNSDDSFDWQDGWRGQDNTNWYAYQTGVANYGLEIESKSVDNAFWPKVTNITLKRAANTTTEDQKEIQLDAIQFKKEGNGDYSNILIDGYGSQTIPSAYNGGAIQILDKSTYDHQVAGGKIKLNKVKIINSPITFISGVPASFTVTEASFVPATNWTTDAAATGATLTPGAWANVDGVSLIK